MNKFLKNNSSTILTVVGSAGVVVTAIMAARDTLKARKRIQYQRGYQPLEPDIKEKIKIAAPCYVPTLISGVSTITCILGANIINKNVQKSLTSAYLLIDQSYREYRRSAKEIYGEEGVSNIKRNMLERRAEETNVSESKAVMFFDYFSLQFFTSSLSIIRDAEKKANEMLKKYGRISLGTVYSLMGQPILDTDDLLGWSIGAGKVYGYDNIKIVIDEAVSEKDGNKYHIIDFVDGPTEDYQNL